MSMFRLVPGRAQADPPPGSALYTTGVRQGSSTAGLSPRDTAPSNSDDHTSSLAAPQALCRSQPAPLAPRS